MSWLGVHSQPRPVKTMTHRIPAYTGAILTTAHNVAFAMGAAGTAESAWRVVIKKSSHRQQSRLRPGRHAAKPYIYATPRLARAPDSAASR
jgi:hypothetical protein